MSQTATRMTLPRAQQLAGAVRAELAPGCEAIEVAGGVRRRAQSVGDLEFVCIAKFRTDLLGNPLGSELDSILDRLVLDDRLYRHKNGDKYKCFTVRSAGCKLDLFICTPETWAVNLMIRTGPETFSKRFVTRRKQGGWLPDNMRIGDGSSAGTNRLYVDGEIVETATEEELFRRAGIKWLEPWERR